MTTTEPALTAAERAELAAVLPRLPVRDRYGVCLQCPRLFHCELAAPTRALFAIQQPTSKCPEGRW